VVAEVVCGWAVFEGPGDESSEEGVRYRCGPHDRTDPGDTDPLARLLRGRWLSSSSAKMVERSVGVRGWEQEECGVRMTCGEEGDMDREEMLRT
jgi:hypothetical protein